MARITALLSIYVVLALVSSTSVRATPPIADTPQLCSETGYLRIPHSVGPDHIRLVSKDGRKAIDRLIGPAALDHYRRLALKHPAAFARNVQSLTSRGFRPTGDVYVERTSTLVSNPSLLADGPIQLINYSESDADGEVVWVSWTDGNDETWEGEIYIEKYSPIDGGWATGDGQLVIEYQSWAYVNDNGGAAYDAGPIDQMRLDLQGVSAQNILLAGLKSARSSNRIELVRWPRNQSERQWYVSNWAQCTQTWCTAAAVSCARRGAAFPACFGATCGGVSVGCAWDSFWNCC